MVYDICSLLVILCLCRKGGATIKFSLLSLPCEVRCFNGSVNEQQAKICGKTTHPPKLFIALVILHFKLCFYMTADVQSMCYVLLVSIWKLLIAHSIFPCFAMVVSFGSVATSHYLPGDETTEPQACLCLCMCFIKVWPKVSATIQNPGSGICFSLHDIPTQAENHKAESWGGPEEVGQATLAPVITEHSFYIYLYLFRGQSFQHGANDKV